MADFTLQRKGGGGNGLSKLLEPCPISHTYLFLLKASRIYYFRNFWLIGKDSDAGRNWGQEEKGTTEDEMGGWHHWLDGRESEWTPRIGDGQGGLGCCDSWGHGVGHDWMTELNTNFLFLQWGNWDPENLNVLFNAKGWQVIVCLKSILLWHPLLFL